MFSKPSDNMAPVVELKAGHAPATKVAGGMRVCRKGRIPSETENKTPSDGSESGNSEEYRVVDNVLTGTGLAGQTNKDYPAEAVKSYHEKPVQQHPNKAVFSNVPHHHQNMPVTQPQRNNH